MFRLKSIIVILSLAFICQNTFAQTKRSAPNKKTSPVTTKKSVPSVGLSDNQIYNRSINGIVIIITDCNRAGLSQGSGFIISGDLVVTNRHVVECGNVTKVKMLISQEIFDVEGVYFHPDKDLAILKVPKLDGKDISLKLAPADTVKMDNLVYVLGNPRSIEGYFSKGNVRLVRPDYFYFDAPIAPGSSGSPVIDSQGRVVGIETTGTRLAGDRIFGGAIFSEEVGRLLPNVRKGQIANVVDKRVKPVEADSGKPAPTERQPASGGIGALIGALLGIPSVTTRNDNDAPVRPKVVREPTVIRELSLEESIADAEAKLNYSPNEALASAQKLLTRLPKDFARREPFASIVHGLIAESYIKLNQTDKAAQHILEAWKDGDFVRVNVKQVREDKDYSNNNRESRQSFVRGTFMMGNKMLIYKQDAVSVGRSFPDQSFTAKNEEMTNLEYSPATKKLSMIVKSTQDGKEVKKDFQFYPPEASLQDRMNFGVLTKKVDCANCSDILIALIKASNDFLRK